MDKNSSKITIIVDTREQAPLAFPTFPSVRGTLRTGDYSVVGFEREFAIERKSLQDLVQTVIRERERFEYELLRLRQYRVRAVVIEATWDQIANPRGGRYEFSEAKPLSVFQSINAFFVRYGVPFIPAGSRLMAARCIEAWARFAVEEAERPKGW